MELVVRGVGGGPPPTPNHGVPAVAVVYDGSFLVVDCGNGAARQLVRAGFRLRDLHGVLLTHHDPDHNADVDNLLALAWTASLPDPVSLWVPPALGETAQTYLRPHRVDVAHREALARPSLVAWMYVSEMATPGPVGNRNGLTITAATVTPPPLGGWYRSSPEGFIVVSGDMAPNDSLVELAAGTDVLVYKAYSPSDLRYRTDHTTAYLADLQQHCARAQATVDDAGRVAAQAAAPTLVLWHVIPQPDVYDSRLPRAAATRSWRGSALTGKRTTSFVCRRGLGMSTPTTPTATTLACSRSTTSPWPTASVSTQKKNSLPTTETNLSTDQGDIIPC